MTKRIEKITSLLSGGESFADVGCDHGYVSQYVLDNKLYNKVYVTDISKPSLDKAINLLNENHGGKFTPILTDGLRNVPYCDTVVIAGMGGEEIIKILQKSAYKPVIAILQPMKNDEKLRKFLHQSGYGLDVDYMFYDDNKYYHLMRAVLDLKDCYTEKEETYGRGNLSGNEDFILYLEGKINETQKLLEEKNLQQTSRKQLTQRLETLRGLKDEIKRDLRVD